MATVIKKMFVLKTRAGHFDLSTLAPSSRGAKANSVAGLKITFPDAQKMYGWKVVPVEIGVVEWGKGVISIKQ
jgi:hypothetical protein